MIRNSSITSSRHTHVYCMFWCDLLTFFFDIAITGGVLDISSQLTLYARAHVDG